MTLPLSGFAVNLAADEDHTMRRPAVIFVLVSFGIASPATAQDAVADAKKACESFSELGATADAAKLVDRFYTQNTIRLSVGLI
jgi:hypothetical protein